MASLPVEGEGRGGVLSMTQPGAVHADLPPSGEGIFA